MVEDAALIVGSSHNDTSDLRIGHAWAAVGRHTTPVQQEWGREFPGSELVFVQSKYPGKALAEGAVDVLIVRRSIDDDRFDSTLVGVEQRYAAVAETDRLARRRSITLHDFADRTVAIDDQTGTTTLDLWPTGAAPTTTRVVHGIEDWLGIIAAGQAIGITAEATTHHYPRPGIVFRPILDTEPVPIWLTWRRSDPPEHLGVLIQLISTAYTH
jgi:DNA-binding transcriptional LysR family regulator